MEHGLRDNSHNCNCSADNRFQSRPQKCTAYPSELELYGELQYADLHRLIIYHRYDMDWFNDRIARGSNPSRTLLSDFCLNPTYWNWYPTALLQIEKAKI